jgi:hypothetical protein
VAKRKYQRINITLNARQRDAIIKRVRADKLIGIGTCSSIDECMTDEEVIEYCERLGISGACMAVAELRRKEALYREMERSVRNEIF